jgi:hypothetical protein
VAGPAPTDGGGPAIRIHARFIGRQNSLTPLREFGVDGTEDMTNPAATYLSTDTPFADWYKAIFANAGNTVADTPPPPPPPPTFGPVPDVTFEPVDQALSDISDAGFTPVRGTDKVDCEHLDDVVHQSPQGGTTARIGSAVTFSLGSKPASGECF